MKRREFITAAGVGGAAAATGAAGTADTAAAQEEEPDWPEFVEEANGFDGTEDMRGEDQVTVSVGAGDGLAFDPPAIWIDAGATVTWEWTGEGGGHNVSAQEGADFQTDVVAEEGFTFEYAFEEEDGEIVTYQCDPHAGQGMHGGVAVGEDVPTREVQEGGGEQDIHEMGVQIHEHFVGIGAILMITVSIIFTFFVLKYGESPHAKGGD